MKRPCDKCTINIQQAMDFDEVTCYLTCKKWKRWSKWKSKEEKDAQA